MTKSKIYFGSDYPTDKGFVFSILPTIRISKYNRLSNKIVVELGIFFWYIEIDFTKKPKKVHIS